MKPKVRKMRRGVTAVEFAMIAPAVFLCVFVGVEFVRANIIRNTAENAAYLASRIVIVPGATRQEAIDKAEQVMGMAGATNVEITFTPDIITDETAFVETTVSVPMDQNSWGGAMFFKNTSITAASRLRTERTPLVQAQSLPTILNPPPPPPPTEPPPPPPPTEPPPPTPPTTEPPPPPPPPPTEPPPPPPPPPILL